MTGFIKHIADYAMGKPPMSAARLAMPPRFSTMPSYASPDEAAAPLTAAPLVETTPAISDVHIATHRLNSTLPDARATTGARLQAAWHITPDTHEVRPATADEDRIGPARESTAPHVDTPTGIDVHRKSQPAAMSREPLHGSALVLPIHRTKTAPPAVTPPRGAQAAPLSAAAVASLAVARPPEPQVIEVTIDRIDIRAPAAERPKHDTSKSRPKPAVDLADYLRNGGGRR